MSGFLLSYSDKFMVALGLWPFVSLVLTLPILAFLYHREGHVRAWSAVGAYLTVLYFLGLGCFTLYPLPSGDTGLGITYGIPPQLNLLAFVGDIQKDGLVAVLQIVANVAFFIPLGFIAGRGLRMRLATSAVLGLAVSLVVETAQLTGFFFLYPYAYRTFDVNDLMWNTSGALIGWACSWALGRILPPGEREEMATTAAPGFVRRCTAFCLDMTLAAVVVIFAVAVASLIRAAWSIDVATESGDLSFYLLLVLLAILEVAIPWWRGGRTLGGGFVRMTCETRERTTARRAVFYAVRFVTLTAAVLFSPIMVPLLGLYFLVKRRMPYDAL